MTAQLGEILIINNQKMTMCSEPLGLYFRLSDYPFQFFSPMTALWRGYVGTWEIIDERLYIIDIHGELEDGSEVNLDTIFPGYSDRVFAHWYSGTLRIPEGKQLEYVHMGYGSKYERDLLIEIENGFILNSETRKNGVSSNKCSPEGYGVAAFTIFGKKRKK